ncbi:MAG TPA: PAS domain S-box protein [Agitococcus sp.]|nr:PAS domain S-box protein [Agitococcus sp.]
MTIPNIQYYQHRARQYSSFAACLCMFLGCLVFVGGWAFDIELLRSLLPNLVSMKANTAFAFILSGAALALHHSQLPRFWAQLISVLVLLIGGLTLLEIIFDLHLGIDELFFTDPYTVHGVAGRMATVSAICFILVGSALLTLKSQLTHWRWFTNSCAVLVLINTFITILGYLYGINSLYQVSGYNPMAIHTALLFFIIAIGLIGFQPDQGFMRLVTADSSAGVLIRRLLPAVMFMPPLLGWLTFKGQQLSWYDISFGWALFAASNIFVFSLLVWWVARAVEQAENDKEKAEKISSWQQAILNSADLTIISTDLQGIILTCNVGALLQLGYDENDIIGKKTPVFFHDPTELKQRAERLSEYLIKPIEPTFELLITQLNQGINNLEWMYIRKDGSRLTVRMSITKLYSTQGELTGYLCISRDISQRKLDEQQIAAQQQELRNAYQRNQAVLDFANYSIIGTDVQGVILTFNKAAEHLLGYQANEVINLHSPTLFHVPNEIAARAQVLSTELNMPVEASFETLVAKARLGTADENEWTYLCKDGKSVSVLLSVTAQHDNKGNLDGFLCIASDITERKRIERMKSEFVSTVSHELRTPLTSIRGALGLVLGKASVGMSEKAKVLLETANRNCERLTLLINDILDLEKIESGSLVFQMNTIDVVSIAQQAVVANEGYAQQHQVKLQLKEGLPTAIILGDEHRLLQVFANLLSNAVKYSTINGQVEISLSQQDEYVIIAVQDHGQGIPIQFRNQIFSRFAQADSSDTRAKGGTGLGLSITKAIVERHHGVISYDSTEGVGTTFYVKLPLLVKPVQSVSPQAKILLCEHHPDTAQYLQQLLTQEGIATEVALDAETARLLLTQQSYRALLLDLNVLEMDEQHVKLIKELCAETESLHLPIIIISSRPQEQVKYIKEAAVNVIDTLQKPVVKEQLQQAVKLALGYHYRPQILHVEDDADIIQVTQTLVEDSADYVYANNLAQARMLLSQQRFDIVLLDLGLPDGSGLELLAQIPQPKTRIVIFSGQEPIGVLPEAVSAILTKSKTSNESLLATLKAIMYIQETHHER